MRLHLVTFGKLKTPGLRQAADYYKKLTRSWVQVEEIELKPVPVPDKSSATRARIQQKETELMLESISSRISPRAEIYLLDETGKTLRTQDWAEHARQWEDYGSSDVVLCIGSSLGFSEELRRKARGTFALGPQTLSHELARIVILEQLYRAWSVIRGHPYHVEG